MEALNINHTCADRASNVQSPGIQRYVAEAMQFKKQHSGGLDKPESKTSPYVQGVLKRVCKNTKYESTLRQALLRHGLDPTPLQDAPKAQLNKLQQGGENPPSSSGHKNNISYNNSGSYSFSSSSSDESTKLSELHSPVHHRKPYEPQHCTVDDEAAYKLFDLSLYKALKTLELPFHLSRMVCSLSEAS